MFHISEGKPRGPEELAETLGYLESVEPLLRKSATLEIYATAPLEQVVAKVVGLVD